MPVKSLNSIFCVLVLLLLAVHTVIVSEARLSTFKVDIQTKRDAAGSTTDVLTEASKLLRKHFIRTSNYSDEEWKTLVKECEKIDDKREAVQQLVNRMDDPYSKVFDSKAMNEKRMSLRGKELTTGLKLNKVMHWNRFADALLDVFGINVILQPFYAIGNKLRVVKGIEASDLHRSQGSRIRSSNGYSGKGLMSYVPFHRATLNSAILSSQNISIALPSRLADTFKLYGLLVLPAIAVIDRRVAMRKATLVLGVAGFARQFYLMLDDSLSSIVIDEISSNCVHSGLVVGDQIVALNGQAIRRSSAKKVLKKLNFGDVGDLVDLTIRRTNQTADGNPFYHTYQVLRDFAPVVTVTHGVLPPQQNCGIGYLSIRQFTDESFNEVVSAIKALKKSIKVEQGLPMKALIIDLRDNPGGSLLPALDIASLFLRRGTLLMQVGVSGRIIKHWSRNWFADKKLSLLLLTNARTASASEILVEALSDNERACTMGARTVGKNVMQAVVALSDGTGICFTIREFYSPTGRFMGDGHTPRLVVNRPIDVNKICFHPDCDGWSLKY